MKKKKEFDPIRDRFSSFNVGDPIDGQFYDEGIPTNKGSIYYIDDDKLKVIYAEDGVVTEIKTIGEDRK